MTATGRNKGGVPIQPKKILRHFAGALPWNHADTAW
jgi:hypothetical protein